MSKSLKGEVGFEVDGEAKVLAYDIEALCLLEDRLDMSVSKIATTLGDDPRLGFLRVVFWAGLQAHHPKTTVKEAGEMIGALKLDRAAELIGEAIVAAFPQSTEAATGGADPQPPADGIGQPS